jgi:fatty acid hydroxylase family protein
MTTRSRAYRANRADLDRRAQARLRADEAAITGNHRRSVRLEQAWQAFWRHPSPWMLTAMLVTTLAARLIIGGWRLGDALVPVVMVAVFPFVEWVAHVCVLHWRPRQIGGLTIDPLLARRHRAHHANPRDVPLVFIPWRALAWVIASYVVVAVLVFPHLGMALTFLTSAAVLGLLYEWTHHLIHSDYRPRSRAYRAVWRNHRLHHYKNERYWFTVTTAGTADRVLHTYPDPQQVETSPTVKDLHAREPSRGQR